LKATPVIGFITVCIDYGVKKVKILNVEKKLLEEIDAMFMPGEIKNE